MKNTIEQLAEEEKENNKSKTLPMCSATLPDGSLVEMIFDRKNNTTSFAVFKDGEWEYKDKIDLGDGIIAVPYSPQSDLLKKGVVLFPSAVEKFESEEALLKEINTFIHKYLDIDHFFEEIASYYVLFTWVYDRFNELPYLRAKGDFGSGKTRFLQSIGVLCYKPIFASGATTVSPVFRIINEFKGTLVLDEGDFRYSDKDSEIVKILNSGFSRGMCVLRSEGKNKYDVKAFDVYCPKIVATRDAFRDRALESRCLTEEMENKDDLRDDIPHNLPDSFWEEATTIRNKLLYWRFVNYSKKKFRTELSDKNIEPRLDQIIAPLISIVENPATVEKIKQLVVE